MLPKLQQTSIAQSLRRDNPAANLQSTLFLIQMRTCLRTLSPRPATNPINLGRMGMHQRTLILPLEISQRITSHKRNLKTSVMSPTTK